MIRTAILALALVAAPSATLAQTQTVMPDVRMLRPAPGTTAEVPTAPVDPVPREYRVDMAVEDQGWIYQEISARGPDTSPPVATTIYQGTGYPATIMVCPTYAPLTLLPRGEAEVLVQNNRCATVTTDYLQLRTASRDRRMLIRYRILAVHRAAD